MVSNKGERWVPKERLVYKTFLKHRMRQTNHCKLDVSISPVTVIIGGWAVDIVFPDIYVEFFTWLGAYYWTWVRDLVCKFSYKKVRYIGKFILFWNTSNFCLFIFIQILKLFWFGFYHDLIFTSYNDSIIFNPPLYHF